MKKVSWILAALSIIIYISSFAIFLPGFPDYLEVNTAGICVSILCIVMWALYLLSRRKDSGRKFYMLSFIYWSCVFVTTVLCVLFSALDIANSYGVIICFGIFILPFYGLTVLTIQLYYAVLILISAAFLMYSFMRVRKDRNKCIIYLLFALLTILSVCFSYASSGTAGIVYNILITACFIGLWGVFFFHIKDHSKFAYVLALVYWCIPVLLMLLQWILGSESLFITWVRFLSELFLIPLLTPFSAFFLLSIKSGTVILCLVSIGVIVLTVYRLKGKMRKKRMKQ